MTGWTGLGGLATLSIGEKHPTSTIVISYQSLQQENPRSWISGKQCGSDG